MGSLVDKATGKAKQVFGDVTGDASTRREGKDEELKGEKKDQLHRAQSLRELHWQSSGKLTERPGCAVQAP